LARWVGMINGDIPGLGKRGKRTEERSQTKESSLVIEATAHQDEWRSLNLSIFSLAFSLAFCTD
jgi:hypothetical protein